MLFQPAGIGATCVWKGYIRIYVECIFKGKRLTEKGKRKVNVPEETDSEKSETVKQVDISQSILLIRAIMLQPFYG